MRQSPPVYLADGDIGSLRWALDPHCFCHALGDYLIIFRAMPTAVQETVVTCKRYVHGEAVEGVHDTIDGLTTLWTEANLQDRELAVNHQRGVNVKGYRVGPYCDVAEELVIRFVDWYCRNASRYIDEHTSMARRSHAPVGRAQPACESPAHPSLSGQQ